MLSPLTNIRRMGVRSFAPLTLIERPDGCMSVYSNACVPALCPLLAVPLTSALHVSQGNFVPAPTMWRSARSVASTVYCPSYFETTGSVEGTADEQEQDLQRVPPPLRERKWLEARTALFVASCLVQFGDAVFAAKGDLDAAVAAISPRILPVLQAVWAMYERHVPLSLLGDDTPSTIEEVEARFRVFQARALLEGCLMDAICSADESDVVGLFGADRVQVPQSLSDVITKSVEIASSGAVFGVPQSPNVFFAPYLSSVCAASMPPLVNCSIALRGKALVLETVRPLRAGEELLKAPVVFE